MRLVNLFFTVILSLSSGLTLALGQQISHESGVPTATQWVLDAVGPTQRNSIRSVFLLICPTSNRKGTAFLLKGGTMVTDAHVVAGCGKEELWAESPMGKKVRFSNVVTDNDRDLALLRSSEKLEGGLELGSNTDPPVGTSVSTWGFPLTYNGPAPLLSVGYVAGYAARELGNRAVKHIIVNGAFNPGNSGGPLFASGDNKVIGIVVWKMRLLPGWIETAIPALSHPSTFIGGHFTATNPDGTTRPVSDQEAIAAILGEFYNTVQVMIGEATDVSELKDLMKSKEKDL